MVAQTLYLCAIANELGRIQEIFHSNNLDKDKTNDAKNMDATSGGLFSRVGEFDNSGRSMGS
jgi:hypothetical protein